ncbi:S-layer homology domain-containing protein [Paenibacillus sp. DMB20]|uniref:S-layer homology domain-containing protein n=1 Tax=Paenibacillus sp. DMB20 TaxID=1642570 RepID=UPI000627AF3D|nr:S-layer homology domain-containing protein [Paenibacillus sp. DMB20]KKO54604.1 S-layer protein [Paenibacillus sp. DMB20]
MKRLMAALLSLMLILTALSGSVQAKGNDISAVSEQEYTRIGEDYDILDDNVLLAKNDGSVWTWVMNKDSLKTLDCYIAEMFQIPGLQDVKQFRYKSHEKNSRAIINYVALKKDGTVWYWDSKITETDAAIIHSPMGTPSPIKELNHVTSLVADFFYDSSNFKTLFVLKSDGSVWSWGSEMGGASSNPIQSKLLDDVVSISSANGFAYAVKKDGSVWSWSTSDYLPHNISKDNGPEQVKGLSDIVKIETGAYPNFAYKKDGTVLSWSAYSPASVPEQLHGATGARSIVEFSTMLQDRFIDSIYALRTDDQLWSVYNDDKVFPGLSDIASVHNKVRDRYSKWYYVLKKDQTLWAWEDDYYSLPKLVVFTKGTAAGYQSDEAGQPTGDQTGVIGTPTGDSSGTSTQPTDNRNGTTGTPIGGQTEKTNQPTGSRPGTGDQATGDRSGTKAQPVIRTSPEISLFPFITMLQSGGQQIITASNVLPGTKITYAIDDPSIGTLSNVNGIPVITANKSGQTIVRATATRAGFTDETAYFLLYVVDSSMLSNTYLMAIGSIPEADRQNPVIVEGLTQTGELVITAASSEKPTPVNGQIIITPELMERLAGNASKAKLAVKQALSENRIVLARELTVNAEIVPSSGQNEYIYKLYKDSFMGRKDIDYITVHAGDAKLVLNVATANRLFDSRTVIVIRLVKANNGGFHVQFSDAQGQELSNVSSNIMLILPAKQTNATHTSVFYSNGTKAQPIGGKFNPSQNGMEAEINRSGTYFVDENPKSFPDVDDRDPELQQAVQFLASKGIVTGKENGNFEPDSLLTRAEFTAMLVRAFYALDETATESFSDVHPPQWHRPYIASSEKKHIVEGYPDGTFKPDHTISREEMTAIGARSLHEKKHYYYPANPELYLNQFVDKETISNWAKPTMSLAVKQRLIDVPANKRINAREAVTRGEAARMLYRLYLQL